MTASGVVIGLVVGVVIGSIFWFLLNALRQKKISKSHEERDSIISSIGEKLADVDVLMASYRSGLIKGKEFRKTLSVKLEAINRLLKPNMHKLEVYYVKYVENLIGEFNRVAFSRTSEVSEEIPDSQISADEDTPAVAFQESFEPQAQPELEVSIPETAQTIKDQEPEQEISSEPVQQESEEAVEVEEKAEAQDSPAAVIAPEEEVKAVDWELQFEPEEEAVEEPAKQEEPQISAVEDGIKEEGEEEQEFVEITLEEKSEESVEAESPAEPEISLDTPEESKIEEVEEEVVAPVASAEEPVESKQEAEDEEFTMETIMDLDISRIPRSPQEFPTELRMPEKKTEISEFEENFKEIEASISEKTDTDYGTVTQVKAEEKVVGGEPEQEIASLQSHGGEVVGPAYELQEEESGIEVFEIKDQADEEKKPEEKAKSEGSEDHDMLTGDDIASKIDAFFKL